MMKTLPTLRRAALVAITFGALLGPASRPAQAQIDPIDCLVVLGSACFVVAEACDALPLVPEAFCDELFYDCAVLAVDICFPELPT